MDQNERQIIDELFDKLRQAEAQSGPRDAQAEQYIREHVVRQPVAPYLMAQAIVIQEQALAASQARIQELEWQLSEQQRQQQQRPAGGFLGSLFGGGGGSRASAPSGPAPMGGGGGGSPWGQRPVGAQQMPGDPRVAAYANPHQQQRPGGGFLAGAMQTAAGVAGGVLIGNALAGMFSGGAAQAGEAVQQAAAEHVPEDLAAADDGGFYGGGEEEEL
jgi:hypothetical protein